MKRMKKLLILLVAIAMLFAMANIIAGWDVVNPGYSLEYARSDRGILPQYVEGNTPQTVNGLMVFKQDYGTGGFNLHGETTPVLFTFYPNPEDSEQILRVWLAYHEGDGKTYVYRWETENIYVHYFMVKGGENFFVYTYNNGFTYDGHLISPRVGVNDQNIADISHIDLVFTEIPAATTTAATTTAATTTAATTTAATTTAATTTAATTAAATTAVATTTATTQPLDETVTVTTTTKPLDETQTQTSATVTLIDDEIPQTGETDNGLVIGLVLLGLAGSLMFVLRRSQKIRE